MSAKREKTYSVKRFEIERAAHASAGGAPALPVLTGSSRSDRFFGKVCRADYLITRAVITRINAVSLNPAVPTITFSPSRIFTSL